jgi:hypothetical protein
MFSFMANPKTVRDLFEHSAPHKRIAYWYVRVCGAATRARGGERLRKEEGLKSNRVSKASLKIYRSQKKTKRSMLERAPKN